MKVLGIIAIIYLSIGFLFYLLSYFLVSVFKHYLDLEDIKNGDLPITANNIKQNGWMLTFVWFPIMLTLIKQKMNGTYN